MVMKINLPISIKRKAYNQCIPPIITNGLEAWSLIKVLARTFQCPKWNGGNNTYMA